MRPTCAAILCLAGIVIGIYAAHCSAGEDIGVEDAGKEGVQYEARGKRDPFVPLAGGTKSAATKLEDITSADDIKVEGIAIGAEGRKMAILNGEIIKEGDKVGEVSLKSIGKKFITVLIGGKSYNIYLPGEDGGSKVEK